MITCMEQLPNNLYSAEQTRELDRLAIHQYGIPGGVLMERAGAAAFEVIKQYWPAAKRLCVVCGTGNNGGDGFVVARLAYEQWKQVEVFIVGDSEKISADALAAKKALEAKGVIPHLYIKDELPDVDVIVDALLGTGLKGGVEGDAHYVINAINKHAAPIIALDIPSGLSSDKGHVATDAVNSEVTISFIGLNRGLFTAQGSDCCGDLVFNDLQIPSAIYSRVPTTVKILTPSSPIFKKRKKESHKGVFGHALIIGGDIGMSGAVRLACEATLKTGVGLLSLATHSFHAAMVNDSRPEIMSYPVNEETNIQFLIDKANVIAMGPGLGQTTWSKRLFHSAINCHKPLVLDADALNILAKEDITRENWILTPHLGEAARLLDVSIEEIQRDRFSAVEKIADKFGGVVVLKGNGSLIYSQGMTYLCDKGNPGMASGGMGDVLTGIIAGLWAQGLSAFDAAKMGVYIHACAGDAAAKEGGERGLLASDLMPEIRRLTNSL